MGFFFFKDDVSDFCFDIEIFYKIWGFFLG